MWFCSRMESSEWSTTIRNPRQKAFNRRGRRGKTEVAKRKRGRCSLRSLFSLRVLSGQKLFFLPITYTPPTCPPHRALIQNSPENLALAPPCPWLWGQSSAAEFFSFPPR